MLNFYNFFCSREAKRLRHRIERRSESVDRVYNIPEKAPTTVSSGFKPGHATADKGFSSDQPNVELDQEFNLNEPHGTVYAESNSKLDKVGAKSQSKPDHPYDTVGSPSEIGAKEFRAHKLNAADIQTNNKSLEETYVEVTKEETKIKAETNGIKEAKDSVNKEKAAVTNVGVNKEKAVVTNGGVGQTQESLDNKESNGNTKRRKHQ